MANFSLGTVAPRHEGIITTQVTDFPLQPVRLFIPQGYQHHYAYPVVVFIHAHGGSDEQAIRHAQKISRRNQIMLSLRGPVDLGTHDEDGLRQFSWENSDISQVTRYLLKALELVRRAYNIHTERVYLVGIGEGAEIAYQLTLQLAGKIAGIAVLNGKMPREIQAQLESVPEIASLRVLLAHGAANEATPLEIARQDFLNLYAAGADVRLNTYPCDLALHPHMFRDINRWIIEYLEQDQGYDVDQEILD
ncbi:MAG: hypothetical protein N2112_15285 [Gemmataceae bacterium]|jgi:phospholipase/carboxylesterase|nr:hypothetical protein [Gemmataceae bacterium]